VRIFLAGVITPRSRSVRESGIKLAPGLIDDGELFEIAVMSETFDLLHVEESLSGQL
jgi:hypothetical protein